MLTLLGHLLKLQQARWGHLKEGPGGLEELAQKVKAAVSGGRRRRERSLVLPRWLRASQWLRRSGAAGVPCWLPVMHVCVPCRLLYHLLYCLAYLVANPCLRCSPACWRDC